MLGPLRGCYTSGGWPLEGCLWADAQKSEELEFPAVTGECHSS